MSKFTYAKCPYCKNEYREGYLGTHHLFDLVRFRDVTEKIVECNECKKKFKIRVHINYYGSKIKGERK